MGIEAALVELTLDQPEELRPGYGGRAVYQRVFVFDTGPAMLRVVTEPEPYRLVLVTLNLSSRYERYGSPG